MEETTQPIDASKQEEGSAATKLLQALTYPVSILAGMWMVNRDVHESTYQNLKRYGAFNDFLKKGEGGGLEARNDKNIQDRIANKISVETFLEKSMGTKSEYTAGLIERMEHMGLGKSYSNFPRKWNYINRTGRAEALLKGATVTGIVAVVLLTVADSKPLLKMMGFESKDKEL
jgi:hypothetical protein